MRPGRSSLKTACCMELFLLVCSCGMNPAKPKKGEFTAQLSAAGARLLSGDTISLSWSPPSENVVARYKDVTGGLDGSDTGWKELPVVNGTTTRVSVALPLEVTDSLRVSVRDTLSGEEQSTLCSINHFVLTAYPDSGVTLTVGDTVPIAWRASRAIGRAILMLAQDGGRTMGYITGSKAISMPQTTYEWVIGSGDEMDISYPATDCSIFILEYDRDDWTDRMPGGFQIMQ